MTTPKNTVCRWYDGGAEDAARFYAATFPDSECARRAAPPAIIPTVTPATS